MAQKNPVFTKNINVSETHPVGEFLLLVLAALVAIVILIVMLFFSMQWIAPLVPFSVEQKLLSYVVVDEISLDTKGEHIPEKQHIYLQDLADNLARAQGLNDDMPITIHWVDDDMTNAFATFGGHIFITKGLWEMMPSENALAMVVAHEIAHINHRDPLKSLGAGLALSLATGLIFGENKAGMTIVGSGGLVTSLHFTRAMESNADRRAMETLNSYYGHVEGATDFFEIILKEEGEGHLEFLQTHPLTRDRLQKLHKLREQNHWNSDPDRVKPLPALN